MSRLVTPAPLSFTVRPLSLDEYHRLIDMEFFAPDEHVELIEGYLHTLSPRRPRHAACLSRLQRLFYACVGSSTVVRSQDPITLAGSNSEPEPDLVLAKPQADDYARRHPEASDILLVIEIADSSLVFDRGTKASLYASASIPEYWIVNLADDCIEVYREPRSVAGGSGEYLTREIARRGDYAAPTGAPACRLAVSDILPF
ncbi:MAG: Uma2 family endonuclease [Anaerolineae bacterium]